MKETVAGNATPQLSALGVRLGHIYKHKDESLLLGQREKSGSLVATGLNLIRQFLASCLLTFATATRDCRPLVRPLSGCRVLNVS
mgnify:CR=1 FL=1